MSDLHNDIKRKLAEIQNKSKKLNEPKVPELTERAKILQEFNGIESDIPLTHRYWKLPRK